jgi:outer membrane protein OmpA-like peptidoglycan-associated protein
VNAVDDGEEEGEMAAQNSDGMEFAIDGYSFNQTKLSPQQERQLLKSILLLKRNPRLNIICTGHACEIGAKDNNYQLGMQRAETVRTYLEKQGIIRKRISVKSKGNTEPIAPNNTAINRAKNRRVEIKLVE